MMKNIIIIILILIAGVLLLKMACDSDEVSVLRNRIPILNLIKGLYSRPGWITHGEVPVDTVVIIKYENPPPVVEVSGGQISSSGDVSLEIAQQDTCRLLRWRTDHYYGTGTIAVSDHGEISIHYPRVAFEPILAAGISNNGVNVGIETLHFNNVLGTGFVLHAPVVFVEADYAVIRGEASLEDSTSIGIGASIDLFPDHTNFRLGGAWTFETDDLKKQGLSVTLQTEIFNL
jgi:hypothetical protein